MSTFNYTVSETIMYSPAQCRGATVVHTVNVEHHLPVGGPDALVKPEPDLPTPPEGVVAAPRGGEERPADRGVPTTFNQNLQQPSNYAQEFNDVQ